MTPAKRVLIALLAAWAVYLLSAIGLILAAAATYFDLATVPMMPLIALFGISLVARIPLRIWLARLGGYEAAMDTR